MAPETSNHGGDHHDDPKSMNLDLEILDSLGHGRPKLLDYKKNPLLISILDAVDTLRELQAQGKIPVDVLKGAKGLLTMCTTKSGFGISLTQGYGLVIARIPGSPTGWSAPLPIKVDGFSIGAVAGWSEAHTFISLATDDDLKAFLANKRAMKIGLDFGLNLADKYEKNVALNTSGMQKDGATGAQTRAFTLTKGVLMDMAMQGTSVEPDVEDIENAYGKNVTAADLLTGKVSAPREAMLLYKELLKVDPNHMNK